MDIFTQTPNGKAHCGTGIGEVHEANQVGLYPDAWIAAQLAICRRRGGDEVDASQRQRECAPTESNLIPTAHPYRLPVTVYMEDMETKHILVVDDEHNMLHTLAFILETANYKVTTAADGQEALEEILGAQESYRPIDLLITDIRLPGLTGLQLIDELNYLKIKMPILVITAYGDEALFIRLMRAGCADYLDKPFDYKELVRRVGLLVEKSGT